MPDRARKTARALAVAATVAATSLAACGDTASLEEAEPTAEPSEPTPSSDPPSEPASEPTPDPATDATTPPPSTTDWAGVVDRVREAVVRLDVASCDSRWMGTGFVVGDHAIMTAAHVALDAQTISVQTETGVTSAELVGLDRDADAALLWTPTDVGDASLELSQSTPALGESLALLGFPGAVSDLRVTQGVVSGLDANVEYPDVGIALSDLIATDAAINGGNSGGPAFDTEGNVIGLVTGKTPWEVDGDGDISAPAEGTGYVVPSAQLLPRLEQWGDQAPTDAGAGCANDGAAPIEDASDFPVEVLSDVPVAQDIARSLVLHGQSINTGSYETAWEIFTPRMKVRMKSLQEWSSGLDTSYWTALRLLDVADQGRRAAVLAQLTTNQDAAFGRDGQTCSQWSLTYSMIRSGAGWLIDAVENADGSPQPC
jgi:S1-C subfamily serine protease